MDEKDEKTMTGMAPNEWTTTQHAGPGGLHVQAQALPPSSRSHARMPDTAATAVAAAAAGTASTRLAVHQAGRAGLGRHHAHSQRGAAAAFKDAGRRLDLSQREPWGASAQGVIIQASAGSCLHNHLVRSMQPRSSTSMHVGRQLPTAAAAQAGT